MGFGANIFRNARKTVPELNDLVDSKRKAEKRTFTGKLRMQILERDNFRCTLCGAGNDIKLVVDHVIPYSQGGKTTLQNGQTLCFDCNSGKSDRRIRREVSDG